MALQLREKWDDLSTRNWIIAFVIGVVLTFIGGAIIVNGAVYYADGYATWKSAICNITNVDTQKIRWGYRAIFEVDGFALSSNQTTKLLFTGKTAVAGDFGEGGVRLKKSAVDEDLAEFTVEGNVYECYYSDAKESYPSDTGLRMIYFDYDSSEYDKVRAGFIACVTIGCTVTIGAFIFTIVTARVVWRKQPEQHQETTIMLNAL